MIRAATIACVVLAMSAGCSRKLPCRVLGQVSFNGKPVAQAQVYFSNASLGIGTLVDVQADGSFEVKTAKGSGLPAGTYQLAVRPPVQTKTVEEVKKTGPFAPPPPECKDIPPKYRNTATSGFQAVIPETGEIALELSMTDP